MSASLKQIFFNVLAVIVGVLIALLCFYLLCFLCFFMGLIGWTDGGTEAEVRLLEIKTTISLITIGLTSALAGGYVASRINTGKSWLPVIITGITLTTLLLVPDDTLADLETRILLLLLLPSTLAGGWLQRKRKRDV